MKLTNLFIKLRAILLALTIALVLFSFGPGVVLAEKLKEEPGNFSLQVTPSPIVETILPGKSKVIELKIRNNGNKAELLKVQPKSFNFKGDTSSVELSDKPPAEVSDWISFNQPTFSIEPGAWYTERITFNPPKTAGFSYSFALVINRVNEVKPTGGNPALQGTVAVFTLLNVDRPGAVKQLSIKSFNAGKKVYEYLPVEFNISLTNNGNTIIQPYGNIYIQRDSKSNSPISVIPVNEARGYILPNTTRSLQGTWGQGFPAFNTQKSADNASEKTTLKWDWSKVKDFRFGRYTAKAVAVYNDGSRDVPLEAETVFWVIPWKIILAFLVVVSLLVLGLVTFIRQTSKLFNSKRRKNDQDKQDPK